MNIAIRCKRTISTWRRIIVSWARLLMIFGEDGWYMVFFSFLFSPWGISPAKSTDFGHCSVKLLRNIIAYGTAASHLFSWKGRGQFSSATPLIISYLAVVLHFVILIFSTSFNFLDARSAKNLVHGAWVKTMFRNYRYWIIDINKKPPIQIVGPSTFLDSIIDKHYPFFWKPNNQHQ